MVLIQIMLDNYLLFVFLVSLSDVSSHRGGLSQIHNFSFTYFTPFHTYNNSFYGNFILIIIK
jgi:hypothetical protein